MVPYADMPRLRDAYLRCLAPYAQVSFNAAIDACGRAGKWRAALSVLDRMSIAGVPRGTITYNAVIAACGKGKEWSRAVSLLHEMLAEHLSEDQCDAETAQAPRADVVSYSAAMDACVRAGRWNEAVTLLGLLQQDRRLNVGGSRGLTEAQRGGRGPKYSTLTLEHLDRFVTVFDRCDDAILRPRANELIETMRVAYV